MFNKLCITDIVSVKDGAGCLKDFDLYLKIYNVIHIRNHLGTFNKM